MMDLTQKRNKFQEIIKNSRMYLLLEEPARAALLDAISSASDEQLNNMVVRFDQDEKKLVAMDKEITDAEAKKKLLEEEKKKFLEQLQVNIKQDAEESAKKAEEILQELKKV